MEGGVQVGGWGRELTDGEEEVQPDFLGCCVRSMKAKGIERGTAGNQEE